jgi:hypothetical protein
MRGGNEGEAPSHNIAAEVHLEITQARKHLRNLLGSHLEDGRQVRSCDRMPGGKKPDKFTTKGVMVTAQPISQLPGKQLQ